MCAPTLRRRGGELCGEVCGSRGLGTQSVPGHAMHHSALHTHRATFIQSTMLTDRGRRVGGGRWGTKALGGVTELGKNWRKCVCVCSCHLKRSIEWFRPSLVVLVTCAGLRVILST